MRSARLLRLVAVASLLVAAGAWLQPARAGEQGGPPGNHPGMSQLTLKERSSRKAMDEQRVNDCKVPADQRGDRHRPADCGAR